MTPVKRKFRFLNGLLGILVILYPFVVFGGVRYFSPRSVALALMLLLLLRFVFTNPSGLPKWTYLLALVPLVPGWWLDSSFFLRWQPVIVNAVLGSVFAFTLWKGAPLVERFARIKHPDLPSEGVVYCRKVTQIWVLFLCFNGCVALYTTLFCSFETWALYNGLIAYILMGALGLGEWLVRRKKRL